MLALHDWRGRWTGVKSAPLMLSFRYIETYFDAVLVVATLRRFPFFVRENLTPATVASFGVGVVGAESAWFQ